MLPHLWYSSNVVFYIYINAIRYIYIYILKKITEHILCFYAYNFVRRFSILDLRVENGFKS